MKVSKSASAESRFFTNEMTHWTCVCCLQYFSFFKYQPRTANVLTDDVEDYLSMCDRTMVGWYHDANNQHWGCYHGTKLAGRRQRPGRGVVPRNACAASPCCRRSRRSSSSTTQVAADGNSAVGPDAPAASMAKQWADAHHTVVGNTESTRTSRMLALAAVLDLYSLGVVSVLSPTTASSSLSTQTRR